MPSGFRAVPGIPVETYQVARKVFNIQHIYIRIGDHLESLLAGCDLAQLDPTAVQNAESVFRLALVTAFQFAESLPDPLAADATLRRMDWKYALSLPVNHPGSSAAALCGFRESLYANPEGLNAFAMLLDNLEKLGLYARGAGSREDPLSVLSTICQFTRFYNLKQTMKATLGVLTSVAPDWMRANALPHWYERYRNNGHNPPAMSDLRREALALGIDARQMLTLLRQSGCPHFYELAEVRSLGRLFEEQYCQEEGELHRSMPGCSGCSIRHQSFFLK